MEEKIRKSEERNMVNSERKIAAFESADYLQRVEDDEQERYLAEWTRKHDRKSRYSQTDRMS